MSTVLVTGSSELYPEIVAAVGRRGDRLIVSWEPVDGLALGSVSRYLQLPCHDRTGHDGAIGRLAGAVADRLAVFSDVAPLLAPDAEVTVVLGERCQGLCDAVRVLASAALEDEGRADLRVRVLTAREMQAVAGARPGEGAPNLLGEMAEGLDFADWRDQVTSLCSDLERTYVGWTRPDGARRVTVIQNAVVTPLRPGPGDDGLDFAWGSRRHPARAGLARALLADSLGDQVTCPVCVTHVGVCDACGGSGLVEPVFRMVPAFVEVFLAALGEESFEIRASDVTRWAAARLQPAGSGAVTTTGVVTATGADGRPPVARERGVLL